MSNPVQELIDRAAAKVGSAYRLAKALDVNPSQLYDWRAGRQTCSPGDRARIAGLAGEDGLQELARATVESAKGSVRRQQLAQVLGKPLRAIGGGLVIALTAIGTFSPSPAQAARTLIDTMCRKVKRT